MIKSLKFIIISLIISIIFLIILDGLNIRLNVTDNMFQTAFIVFHFIILIISPILGLIISKILINKEKIKYIENFILTSFIFSISLFIYPLQSKFAELIGYKPIEYWDIHKVVLEDKSSIWSYIGLLFSILVFYTLISLSIQILLKLGSYILFLNKNKKKLNSDKIVE